MKWTERAAASTREWARPRMLGQFLAAVVIGASAASLLPPDPVTLPVVGTVPGLLAGGLGLVTGLALYVGIPSSSDCGCSGDCNC